MDIGITYDDARNLRKAAMVLHRWYEMECGSSDDFCSWVVVRGHKDQSGFTYNDDGKPFIERHDNKHGHVTYLQIDDRERGATKRIMKIMAGYPGHAFYLQTDVRGAPLYIIPKERIPFGEDIGAYYLRGVAVYK